ncbi:MAG: DUF58 domain-containing protein [Desulfobulbaceae bacterium]|nr:MAG: DUF58 domain-containing protein [Desulfobulbaceae bacterium]
MQTLTTKDILKKVRRIEIRTNRLVSDVLAGSYHSVFKGRGINFDEVREYISGDDVRTIDWNVTARTGAPHIKKFSEERELTIILMIDISASGNFGSQNTTKRELMAELGSILAFSAVKNNDKVGLLLFTDSVELYIPPAKGRTHILRVIREILYFKPKGTLTDFALPLDFISKVTRRRAIIFLLSDYAFSNPQEAVLQGLQPKLKICNKHHDLISIMVSDPREFELPDLGWITLEDTETGNMVEVNSGDPLVREQYKRLNLTRKDSLKKTLNSAGIDFLDLSTDHPYVPELLSFFGTRKRRYAR